MEHHTEDWLGELICRRWRRQRLPEPTQGERRFVADLALVERRFRRMVLRLRLRRKWAYYGHLLQAVRRRPALPNEA